MSEYGSARAYRARDGGRQRAAPPQADAIATALTIQLIVCIVLLLAFAVIKKIDTDRFDSAKQEFSAMAADEAETIRLVEWLRQPGLWDNISVSLDRFLAGLFHRDEPQPESQPEPETENDVDEPPVDPPVDPPEEQREAPALPGYNYLTPEASATDAGAGGLFMLSAESKPGMQPAPNGSLLSPVYLSIQAKPPITGLITSGFCYRVHPLSGENDFHTGLDIAAEEGRDILAALPGLVTEVGWSEIYGNYIILKHSIHLETKYAHCSQILAQEGIVVAQGERIASVGQTGAATGPHLHFAVIVDGSYTDPEYILADYIRLVG